MDVCIQNSKESRNFQPRGKFLQEISFLVFLYGNYYQKLAKPPKFKRENEKDSKRRLRKRKQQLLAPFQSGQKACYIAENNHSAIKTWNQIHKPRE